MTIKDLKKFGTLRKTFQGQGLIKFNDGAEIRARFSLGQLTDAQLIFCVDVNRSVWDFVSGQLEVENLNGILLDGHAFSLQGPIHKEFKSLANGVKTRLIGYSSQWIVGEQNFDDAASIAFELVNFRFLGTEVVEFVSKGVTQGATLAKMTLDLNGREVVLQQVPDYNQVVATLRAQRAVQVTCIATTILTHRSEIESTMDLIDRLCELMSVARGTLVNWTSFDVKTANGTILYSRYQNSVTRRFAGIELVDDSDPPHTKLFLEKAIRRCQELDADFQIRKVARAFVETRDGPFLESRGLLIAVLVEYLASVRARVDNRINFIDEEVFDPKWNLLREEIKAIFIEAFPNTDEAHLRAMLGSAKSINRRPLSWKLNGLAKWLNVKLESGEVERFVNARNKLAHEGRFPETDSPIEHYKRMQHFIDRLMLRLFDYHGPYYDFEHREIRQT